MFDNDASGCYDHIVVALATSMALHLGMCHRAACMQAMGLASMVYFIKMMHGISDASYWSSWLYQLFGTGQGSGGSLLISLSIVVVLLQTLSSMAPIAMSFADPWGNIVDVRNADSMSMILRQALLMPQWQTLSPFQI
jgi:hypothetical protein